jgi:hypothetical protein
MVGVSKGPAVAVAVAVGVLLGVGVLVAVQAGLGVLVGVSVTIGPPKVAVGPASISFRIVRAVIEVMVWTGILTSGTIGS